MLISDIYNSKPITFPQTATIEEAIKQLMKSKINALVIVDHHDKVVGVLSLQDIAAATIPRQFRKNTRMAAAMYRKGFFTQMCQELKKQPVSKIMRTDFVSVEEDDNIMTVTADFLNNDLYVIPVVKKRELIGIVTRSEIKHALLYGMRHLSPDQE